MAAPAKTCKIIRYIYSLYVFVKGKSSIAIIKKAAAREKRILKEIPIFRSGIFIKIAFARVNKTPKKHAAREIAYAKGMIIPRPMATNEQTQISMKFSIALKQNA